MANPNPKTDHLPKIQPGEVRNPNGSSKKQRFTNALVALIESHNADNPFVQAGLNAALRGDFNFWKYIYERIEGKIPEPPESEPEVTMEEVAKRLRERKNAKRKKAE